MTVLLENIKKLLKKKKINTAQALYLIYAQNEISIPIGKESLRKLVKDNYIVGNSVAFSLRMDKKVYDKHTLRGSLTPNYTIEKSSEMVKKLCSLFCEYDKNNELIFPGDEYVTPEQIANQFLQKEEILVYYFLIFLFMFPIRSKENKRWERHFTKTRYTGAQLRTKSKALGTKFIKVAKKYDMGAILFGTYLFISDSIVGGKPFIKKPMSFLKDDFETYVSRAAFQLKKLDKEADVTILFRKSSSTNDTTLTVL